jgi:hypothetical protein
MLRTSVHEVGYPRPDPARRLLQCGRWLARRTSPLSRDDPQHLGARSAPIDDVSGDVCRTAGLKKNVGGRQRDLALDVEELRP